MTFRPFLVAAWALFLVVAWVARDEAYTAARIVWFLLTGDISVDWS